MLVKEKPNGKFRIRLDPSQTREGSSCNKSHSWCISEAFQTIVLDGNSSLLTTFQGPTGRYCYNHMPFGIASGPEEYQRRQHEFLVGLRGVINIADDIWLYGWGDTKEDAGIDHDRNLVQLLERCAEHDLQFREKNFSSNLHLSL